MYVHQVLQSLAKDVCTDEHRDTAAVLSLLNHQEWECSGLWSRKLDDNFSVSPVGYLRPPCSAYGQQVIQRVHWAIREMLIPPLMTDGWHHAARIKKSQSTNSIYHHWAFVRLTHQVLGKMSSMSVTSYAIHLVHSHIGFVLLPRLPAPRTHFVGPKGVFLWLGCVSLIVNTGGTFIIYCHCSSQVTRGNHSFPCPCCEFLDPWTKDSRRCWTNSAFLGNEQADW